MNTMSTQTKPLDCLTIAELLDAYGRTCFALADYDSRELQQDPAYQRTVLTKRLIESEARRRDQATWMPAAKEVKREPDGEILFA